MESEWTAAQVMALTSHLLQWLMFLYFYSRIKESEEDFNKSCESMSTRTDLLAAKQGLYFKFHRATPPTVTLE